MDVSLPNDLHEFIRKKVESGQFPSEAAVIEAALARLRSQEGSIDRAVDGLIDHDFVAYCSREADEHVTLDAVLAATSAIEGSMSRAIVEDERADRF